MILRLGPVAFFRLMPRQLARCRAAFAAIPLRNRRGADGPRNQHQRRSALDRCDCGDCGISSCDGDAGGLDAWDVPCDYSF